MWLRWELDGVAHVLMCFIIWTLWRALEGVFLGKYGGRAFRYCFSMFFSLCPY